MILRVAAVALGVLVTLPSAAEPRLTVAISPDRPPFVMDRATRGLAVEVMQRALPGFTLDFVQMPGAERATAVQDGRADASAGVQCCAPGASYSGDMAILANAAFSKAGAGLEIASTTDLAGLDILALQGADQELDDTFAWLFGPDGPSRATYRAFADPQALVTAFWEAEAAVAVLDRAMFEHLSGTLGHRMSEATVHEIFGPGVGIQAAFAETRIRNRFDRGLEELCRTGTYDALLFRYAMPSAHSICR